MRGRGRSILASVKGRLDSAASVAGSAATVLTFGMLLWGRLLMTQSIPETALARPKRGAAAERVAVSESRETVHVDLGATTDRDLFAVRVDLYVRE